ncbi:MAG: thioredoxin domain-containing protein [Sphingomonadales bacterium]
MTTNQLGSETSPYLLQHKDNPVHWRTWRRAAFQEAEQTGKPILLSIGYAACHWCHVMARESFDDPATAKVMNEFFINIKVDREQRPDIDVIYQTALAFLGQPGGWPLTMFLTPRGEPFWGGTYFPPEPGFGRPSFRQVLHRVHEVHATSHELVTKNKTALIAAMREHAASKHDGELSLATLDELAQRTLAIMDPKNGGAKGAPKFPQPTLLEFLWRAFLRTGDVRFQQQVELTLTRMSQGGIYDHLGGGYARYAVDERWLAPHFEKMLYDNAQMIDLLCLAWQTTRNPLFETRVRETVAWVLREMATGDGGFASSLDADSDGGEGRFFTWLKPEIDQLLGHDASLFRTVYDVTETGNWQGRTILNRLTETPPLSPDQERDLATARSKLWSAREQRTRPARDDKVLADWSGLMIAALANAGAIFGESDWIATARKSFAFITHRMTHISRSGERCLKHSYRAQRLEHPAILDDYAAMARAALVLCEVTGDQEYVTHARHWVAILDAHYRDNENGGYFLTADDIETPVMRPKSAVDHPSPSGNGLMVGILARLYYHTGEACYRDRAHETVRAFAGAAAQDPSHASLLNGFETLCRATQIVICGPKTDPHTQFLIDAAREIPLSDRILTVIESDAELPQTHPARAIAGRGGQATAYVCVGSRCSPPVTDPEQLKQTLKQ